MKLKGIRAVITGGSLGLGREITRQFLCEGASVVICARHAKQLAQTVKELDPYGKQLSARVVDVSKPAQVDRFVRACARKLGGIDVLVNNAGVFGVKGLLETVSWKEWVKTLEINLFGTVYMAKATLPYMKKCHSGKIINLSGGGATFPFPYFSAYAASKAAVVRFTETLAMEVKKDGIAVNAVAPGPLNTRFLGEAIGAGPRKVGKAYYEKALAQKKNGGASLECAAKLCVFLASSESRGINGKLISAVWDSWEALPRHQKDLEGSDLLTLRRIIPQDRGHKWGKR